jgi:hypothetical protein
VTTYSDLGPRTKTGTVVQGVNGGNWTVEFTPTDIASSLNDLEMYHAVISGPVGSTFTVFRNSDQWGGTQNGFINEWDPSQPMPFNSGTTIFFYWNTSTAPAPQVTIWIRTHQE